MTWLAESLWDLLKLRTDRAVKDGKRRSASTPLAAAADVAAPELTRSHQPAKQTMQERYDALVIEMKSRFDVRVRKWRTSSTGCAWEIHYHNGSVKRLIESPYPRGPMSCAIFLHEIGHHAIGFGRWRPRCLEELKAWQWSLQTMRQRDLNVTPAVERRMHDSLKYAVAKAMRRGIQSLPAELEPYLPRR